jgi:hypothetical protein
MRRSEQRTMQMLLPRLRMNIGSGADGSALVHLLEQFQKAL